MHASQISSRILETIRGRKEKSLPASVPLGHMFLVQSQRVCCPLVGHSRSFTTSLSVAGNEHLLGPRGKCTTRVTTTTTTTRCCSLAVLVGRVASMSSSPSPLTARYNSPALKRKHVKQEILRDNNFNKDTAFPQRERDLLCLHGLLPPRIETIQIQAERSLRQLRSSSTSLEKYIFLTALKSRNQTLFYYLLINNLEELLPIVYTPTVGEACIKFGHIYRVAEGMYFTKNDMGSMRKILNNWQNDVDIIVVTDGSRILGLGDLGAGGMGIPIGKLSLYVAAAGFHPARTLPVLLDTGTNNPTLLSDPLYLGMPHKRLPDDLFYKMVDEFLMAVKDKWPEALVQFEDFSNDHCFELLERYRTKLLCFNDDIQGTGAVIASGIINAAKVVGLPVTQHRFVFLGAGSAGIGVADAIVHVMEDEGLSNLEARRRFWFVDSKGLVTNNRGDELQAHKIPYARDDVDKDKQLKTLLEVVSYVKPTGLIGLSGIPKSFSEEIIREVYKHCKRPIIFALSNPTSKSECTAGEAYTYTDGNAVFASGSPFEPVILNGKTYYPGQGNNMYIFPGLGFGAVLAKAKMVSNGMISTAARALADFVTPEEIENGRVYPPLNKIREISAVIATKVIQRAFDEGLAGIPAPCTLEEVKERMYQPEYQSYEDFIDQMN